MHPKKERGGWRGRGRTPEPRERERGEKRGSRLWARAGLFLRPELQMRSALAACWLVELCVSPLPERHETDCDGRGFFGRFLSGFFSEKGRNVLVFLRIVLCDVRTVTDERETQAVLYSTDTDVANRRTQPKCSMYEMNILYYLQFTHHRHHARSCTSWTCALLNIAFPSELRQLLTCDPDPACAWFPSLNTKDEFRFIFFPTW